MVTLITVMAKRLNIPTTNCNYFDYLRIEKSQRRGKNLQKLQRKLESPLLETTAYLESASDLAYGDKQRELLVDTIGAGQALSELADVTEELMVGDGDLLDLRLAVLVAGSSDSLQSFIQSSFRLFDTYLGEEEMTEKTCSKLLTTHIFLSAKVICLFFFCKKIVI